MWYEYGEKYHFNAEDPVRDSHGKRTADNLKIYAPQLSDEEAAEEAKRFEDRVIEVSEMNRRKLTSEPTTENPMGTIVGCPGVKELLAELNAGRKEDPSRRAGWAIVTSATGDYARKAFLSTGVAELPDVFIDANHVTRGKPDPQPYLVGAEHCHVDISKCIVMEDAPAGVQSGKRAGARVLAALTTHDAQRLWDAGADWVVKDLSKVHARWEGSHIVLTIESETNPKASS